jgi:uridylate kinase
MAGKSYRRVLLKLSGETLSGNSGSGIDPEALGFLVGEISEARKAVKEIAIVLGGGNIFRGIRSKGFSIDKKTGDYMGMLATVINGLALRDALKSKGVEAFLVSAIPIQPFAEGYTPKAVLDHLKNKEIVIFAGGTGHPFFTTDTAATLRALEIGADILLKATKVDGVFSADPKKDKKAKKYDTLCYDDVIKMKLNVMDLTAVALAREDNLPIQVFDFFKKGNLKKALLKEKVGSIVKGS